MLDSQPSGVFRRGRGFFTRDLSDKRYALAWGMTAESHLPAPSGFTHSNSGS